MRKRWLIYLLAGVIFGVFDFYYQTWIQLGVVPLVPPGSLGSLGMTTLILIVWLVLVIPVALYEARAARSAWRASAAGAFTWSVAVIAYYLFNGVKLILIGEPSRPEMHISSRADPYYWLNIKSFFTGDFVSGVSEWLIVAVVGGSIIGLLVGLALLRFDRPAALSSDESRLG